MYSAFIVLTREIEAIFLCPCCHAESYDEGDKPETEADATLRFLQDSMFHYLTTEKDASQTHMRAMIRIMGFTDPQKKKIRQAIVEKKKKNPEVAHILNIL